MQIEFTLNGNAMTVDAPPHITLLRLLRDHLNLTGTKEGCDIGECGACSVLVDGQVVNACLTLAPKIGGRNVTTIEGIHTEEGELTPLQQAFVRYGAIQCGYCVPGLVMASESLLSHNPHPSRAEIREAIAGNLCRCTGYHQIIDAIAHAASDDKVTG